MSDCVIAVKPDNSSVIRPISATNNCTEGAISNSGCVRAIRYTPAVTMVAAWIRALIAWVRPLRLAAMSGAGVALICQPRRPAAEGTLRRRSLNLLTTAFLRRAAYPECSGFPAERTTGTARSPSTCPRLESPQSLSGGIAIRRIGVQTR